jgi:hypothetical protein
MKSKAIIVGAVIAGLMSGAFVATSHAAVSIGKPGVSLQAGKKENDKNSCKGKGCCKVSAFLPKARLDNAVTEARIPQ